MSEMFPAFNTSRNEPMIRCLLIGMVVVCSVARAERTQVVVISAAANEVDRDAAAMLAQQLTDSLKTRNDFEVIDLTETNSPMESAERRARGESGREALRAANAKRDRDPSAAALDYATALQHFKLSDWRSTRDDLVVSLAWQTVLSTPRGDLRSLLTIKPDFPFSTINPDVDEFIVKEKARLKISPVTFAVKSDCPALVWIDGVLEGSTPLSRSRLAGWHRITVSSPGKQLYQEEHLLDEKTVVDVSLQDARGGPDLRAELAAISAGLRTGDYLIPIKRFVERRKVREVLVVGLGIEKNKGHEVRLIRMGDASAASVGSRTLAGNESPEKIHQLARTLFDRPVGITLSEGGPVAVVSGGRTGGFVSLGVGVGLTVIGGVLAAIAGAAFSDAQLIPQVEQARYERATADASGFLGSGVVTASVGLVGIALGGILLATSPSTPAALTEVVEVPGE